MQLFKYEAVIAKCRALYGKLLKADDYEMLLKSTSISEIAVYLRDRTAYAEFFSDAADLKTMNRAKLEYYIRKSLISDFVKIYRFIYGKEHHFINLLLARFELEFILKTWRHFVWLNRENNSINSINGEDDNKYLLDVGVLEMQMISMIYQYTSKIDIEALKNVSNIGQFMEAISKTNYFNIFEKYMGDGISQDYTKLEAAIYNEYYRMLYDAVKIFDRDTQEKIRRLISIEIDLINLERISRIAVNFSESLDAADRSREIMPLLVPIRFKLRAENIQQLITLENKNDFLTYCDSELYYGSKKSFRVYDTFEQYRRNFLYNIYRSGTSHTRSGLDVIIKYFFIKETEIKNLFYLIEGIRYSMNSEEIRPYLIGVDYGYSSSDEGNERGTV